MSNKEHESDNHSSLERLRNEAILFAHYYTSQDPTDSTIKLYSNKVLSLADNISDRDLAIVNFATRNPATIGLLDSGLALVSPHAELRRRLYIMFAILEAIPQYADFFLPRQRSMPYVLFIAITGMAAGFKACVGLLLLRIIRT